MDDTGRGRLHPVDWLRALAVLGVFVYHCAQPFSTDDWHVKNDQKSEAIGAVIAFVGSWGLVFFFLIAGAGVFLSLRRRTIGQYVTERLTRLGAPLLVGYLLLAPLQSFIEERHFGRYEGSFVSFVPIFFGEVWTEVRGIGPGSDPLLVGHMYHLWFIVFLLEFSLIGIPAFAWLRGERGRAVSAWLGERSRRRGWTLLAAVPIAAASIAVWAASPGEHAWGEFTFFFGSFLAGFVLATDERLFVAVRRDVVPAFVVGFVGVAALLVSDVPGFIESWNERPTYSWAYVWFFTVIVLQAWAWSQAALGVGLRVPVFQRPLPRSVAQAAMPFFVLHQPVIVAVSFRVVRWDAGIGVKFMTVLAISFAITGVLSWAVTRIPVVSVGFGVKRSSTRRERAERHPTDQLVP